MADRYVVPAGGNSNTTATWSTTSGGAGGASIPVAGDTAFLDSASGQLTVTGSTLTVGRFDCTGYTNTLTGTNPITITGDTFKLVPTMTVAGLNVLTFTGADAVGDVLITTAGKSISSGMTINGVSKVFKLADAYSGSSITITNGTFNSQGNDLNLGTGSSGLSSNNTNVRSILLAGSDLRAFAVNINATNLTWTAPDSITVSFQTAVASTLFNGGVAVPVLNIDLAYTTAARYGGVLNTTGGTLVINELAFINAPSANLASMVLSIAGNFQIDKVSFSKGVSFLSSAPGTQRTITSASGDLLFDGCMIRDIVVSGANSAIATNSIDLGNNSGISFQNFRAATHEIVGTTLDDAGAALPSCTVVAFKEDAGVYKEVSRVTSDGTTGAYTLPTPNNDADYLIVATKTSANRADAMNGITPTAP